MRSTDMLQIVIFLAFSCSGMFSIRINTREPCAEFRKQLAEFRPRDAKDSAWEQNIHRLRQHLTEDCAELHNFHKDNWQPPLFHWPENAIQNKEELANIPPKWDFWLEVLHRHSNYGPVGVKSYDFNGSKVQLDRVQQVWSLSELSDTLAMPMQDEQTVFLEFGGGTGQMASVVQDANFKGSHFVYDYPEMLMTQKYFNNVNGNTSTFVLDSIPDSLSQTAGKTNLLSNTETESLTKVLALPKIYFAGTYSFTEADESTRSLFMPHFKNFDGIYLVYWHKFDGINNDNAVKAITDSIAATHQWKIEKHWGNHGMSLRAWKASKE